MEKREEALREALAENAEETTRWENYQKENRTAIENLDNFGKHLTVDVMVPIGSKAFMPGQLVHTNEVLVGHFQGYFSKCSAHKAKEICEHRLRIAEEHLKNLHIEEELWQNKLDKPYVEGALPNVEEREIIEDYDEEKEKRWREQHKLRLRKAKMQEKEARKEVQPKKATKDFNDEHVFEMLEEAELMEELEQELEALQVDEVNDETIRQLMSGEMRLPSQKSRTAHEAKVNAKIAQHNLEQQQCIVKKAELKSEIAKIPATNNNNRPNPELIAQLPEDDVDSGEEQDTELTKEVQVVKKQAEFLPAIDQIGFYEYQIQIIQQKLQMLPLITQQQIEEKIHLLTVLDNLEELLDTAEETVGAEELAEQEARNTEHDNNDVEKEDEGVVDKLAKPTKRRISFALEDQTLEFRRNETVSQMLPKPKRDVISLDETLPKAVKSAVKVAPKDKREIIAAKVERNLRFMAENQSTQDFDLVNKILDSTVDKAHTLHINFQHSKAQSVDNDNAEQHNIPGSPADCYKMYKKSLEMPSIKEETQTIFIDGYEGEEHVKVPILREANRQTAYEDPKIKFMKNTMSQNEVLPEIVTDIQGKSILRNKTAVDKEQHLPTSKIIKPKKSKTKPATVLDEVESMSAYNKVMNEVVEKPLTEPESLPTGKYIDAHAPKKRISRFKQQRAGVENT